MKLNLGASDQAIPGFLSVDICPPADIVADLSKPWPWPDSSVDEVLSSHLFEHLPSRVHTMNELHRVLKPGARARIIVPSATKGAGYAQDPTHVSPWCMNSFQYFEAGTLAHTRLARAYGITAAFRVIELREDSYQDVREPVYVVSALLEAVK
jgi:predicted SAM-dependent methyltransferase